jgi:hypothetical protein
MAPRMGAIQRRELAVLLREYGGGRVNSVTVVTMPIAQVKSNIM